jgi:hypothetical protein
MQNNQIGEQDVDVNVDYASYENGRGEDHAFFDQAVEAVEQKALAMIYFYSGTPLLL